MITDWIPSDDYPGLTAERLAAIGDVIWVARNEAADDYRPDKGETNWTLGVSGFERSNFAVSSARAKLPWLSIIAGAGGGPVMFVASIGGHPLRFYRGEPEDIPVRYRQMSFPEFAGQKEAAKLYASLPGNRGLRIAIENDPKGRPSAIYLVEMDEDTGDTLKIYEITRQSGAGNVKPFVNPVSPVVIPPVTAELIGEDTDQRESKS